MTDTTSDPSALERLANAFPNGNAALEAHLPGLLRGMLQHTITAPDRLRRLLAAAETLRPDTRIALTLAYRRHSGAECCHRPGYRSCNRHRETWSLAYGSGCGYGRCYMALAKAADPILQRLRSIHAAAYAAGLSIASGEQPQVLAGPWLEVGLTLPGPRTDAETPGLTRALLTEGAGAGAEAAMLRRLEEKLNTPFDPQPI